MRVAGVFVHANVGPLLRHDSVCRKLFENPLLQGQFRNRLIVAHPVRCQRKSILHDAVNDFARCQMAFKLFAAPARFVLLH
jgi:hypothetical protein